jgi:hypothetical protein
LGWCAITLLLLRAVLAGDLPLALATFAVAFFLLLALPVAGRAACFPAADLLPRLLVLGAAFTRVASEVEEVLRLTVMHTSRGLRPRLQ